MSNTIEYKIVEKEDFLEEYAAIRSVIIGKGKIIAEEAGVSYHTYRNAVSGRINNPATLGSILLACKLIHKGIIDKYKKKG